MFNIGVPELILILVVGLIVLGPKKLPEMGKAVGKGLREFKKAVGDIQKSIEIDIDPVKTPETETVVENKQM